MDANVGLFDQFYGVDPAKADPERKELARARTIDGFDAAIRSEKEVILDLKEEAQGLISSISNGKREGIKRLGEIDLLIADAEVLISAIKARKHAFFPDTE